MLSNIVEQNIYPLKPKYLLIGLAAYLGAKVFAKKNAAERLNYFVQKVSLRFSGFTPILDVVLAIQNPTGTTLNVGSIVGDLYINDNYVANISGYQLTQIKPMGATLFPLSARLSIAGVIGEAKDIIDALMIGNTNVLLSQTLRFNGNVYAEGLTMPLKFTYKVL